MNLSIRGIGFVGAALADWTEAAAALRGGDAPGHMPLAELGRALKADRLPRTERRRAGKSTRLAMTACWEAVESAGLDPATLPMVFASSTGDTEVLTQSCASLAEPERMISPIRFHNSVHNAASGYWSIAVGAREPATAIAAHHETAAVGLLEAAMQATLGNQPVLLAVYDLPFPEPMCRAEPIAEPMAVGLVIAPAQAGDVHRVTLGMAEGNGPVEGVLGHPDWERMRRGVPAGRLLPLLDAIARGESRQLHLVMDGTDGLEVNYQVNNATQHHDR
ncbi:beta-ketoacyl synthase chain length factor [Guyparkeria hydrothermalis]|uniref:beta-ketoacyl synthase chain length factor n=1 Tax=Guyparkeria hydrothermalis TaxID=923 RepID=UPI002021D9C5|nr:beta-ketoacyl synthase chain length factor [Guyparkeria hydrothermalis]MCL7751227.1 beta-ketoacyl synthase chain length factor [Guyparkeria hydrothermalis]